jgi:DNA helicase II / ATP-dependent DNA helicase PcrA
MSISADLDFFKKIVPSKIFEIGLFNTVHVEHNRSIAALTDPVALGYTKNIDKIVGVLTDPEIAQYQDKLLQEAVNGICAEKVDIDHIQIGLKLTEQDFTSLLNPKSGLNVVKTKARNVRLQVSPKGLGATNQGFKKSDKRPFFTHKYRMIVDHDTYRYMDVLIADPNHLRNDRELQYNCLIECIPTRLTPQHISLMLFHVKSALKPNRYDQLIKHALLLRLDTGYVMHGVSQLFAFTSRYEEKIKAGSCIPKDGRAVETTYIGDRDYKHVIAYDKVLKENKKFVESVFGTQRIDFERVADKISGIDEWFPKQAASLRVESRDFMYKNPYMLCNMETCCSLLEDVSFVRPTALLKLNTKHLKAFIKDKKIKKVREMRRQLARMPKIKVKEYRYRFDIEKVQSAFKTVITELKDAIFNPSSKIPMPIQNNYSAKVIEARKIVAPLIADLRSKQDSLEDIVQCTAPAIYVEGCPGSGKTALIVERVKYLIESGVDAANICVLAFTNDASEVFIERLKEHGLMQPSMFVGTFSSWCNKGFLHYPKDAILTPKSCIKQIQSLLPTTGRLAKYFDAEDLAGVIFSLISYAANFDQPILNRCIKAIAPQLNDSEEPIKAILKSFEEWKKNSGKVDFNDFLLRTRQRLEKKRYAVADAKRFKHIILDEVQDTNAVQWSILKRLINAGSHFFCVGDPAQSMYGFRGANDKELDTFSKKFNNGKVFNLINNYRSSFEIAELGNHVRRKVNRNYSQSLATCPSHSLPRSPSGIASRYKNAGDLKSASDWLVADIQSLDRESFDIKDTESHCLVLCRYNAHVEIVEKALEKAGALGSSLNGVRVKVMTYHGGKGLEATHCYVVDPLFSSYRLGTKKEELCNTYVALTRAKERLTIIASPQGSALYGTENSKKSELSIFGQLCIDFEDNDGLLQFIS